MPRPISIAIGDKFGKLTIQKFLEPHVHPSGQWHPVVECACECGTTCAKNAYQIIAGHTVSCGCVRRNRFVTHKQSGHWLFPTWKGMHARCYNKKHSAFKNYSERGITVCDEWHSPEVFIAWALKHGAEPHLDIDRRDNNGNYSPDNCRFVTRKINCRNTRHNRLVTYKGKTLCVAEWCETLGLNVARVNMRLRKYGWSVERAFEEPSRRK